MGRESDGVESFPTGTGKTNSGVGDYEVQSFEDPSRKF